MRTVFVELKIKVEIDMEEGVEVAEVVDDLFYELISNTPNSHIENTEITDYEIIDSK